MSPFFTKIILTAVTALTSRAVTDKVMELVKTQLTSPLSGEEKRAEVKRQIDALKTEVGSAFAGVSNGLLNLVIEAVVAYVQARLPQTP